MMIKPAPEISVKLHGVDPRVADGLQTRRLSHESMPTGLPGYTSMQQEDERRLLGWRTRQHLCQKLSSTANVAVKSPSTSITNDADEFWRAFYIGSWSVGYCRKISKA